jgi:hypothetical protein
MFQRRKEKEKMSKCKLLLFVFFMLSLITAVSAQGSVTVPTPAYSLVNSGPISNLAVYEPEGELSPNSVAVEPAKEPVDWWKWFVGALGAAWTWFLAKVAKNSKDLIPKAAEILSVWLKSWNHWRGDSVVIDSGIQVLQEAGEETRKSLEDGVLTKDERAAISAKIGKLAKEKLKNLYGFYKADLDAWVEERVSVFLGKFLYRNSTGSGSKIP